VKRASTALLLLLAAAGCGKRTAPPPRWEFGYWFWRGSGANVELTAATLDALFVQVGDISFEHGGRHVYSSPRWPAFHKRGVIGQCFGSRIGSFRP